MVIPALIEHKRDGGALTAAQWSDLIRAYVAGQVPDYQMSALLMAIYFRGLEPAELTALTDTMIDSGDRLHFDGHPRPVADKHSTGGPGPGRSTGLCHAGANPRDRPRRQAPLCSARCHGDRRVDSPHLRQHHVE